MYRKNTAGQFIGFQLNKAADGTGLTGATVAVRRCIDGTFAAGDGTVTEDTGAGSSAGFYKYAMSQADTNGNNISMAFTATGGIAVEKTFITTAADPTDGVRLGLTALPNATAGGAGGVSIVGSAMTLTSGERTSVADAMLDRDMSTGTDSGSTTVRTARQALRFLRNKWTVATGTLTVYKENDTTVSWTGAVSTDAAAVPIVGNDPAG